MTEPLDGEQERVRALLRAAADPGPMPTDVVTRVEAALAAERVAAVDLTERRLRRAARWRRGLGVAAAVAVLGGGVWAVQGQISSGTNSATSAGGSGLDQPESSTQGRTDSGDEVHAASLPPVLSTGTDYTSPDQLLPATATTDAGGTSGTDDIATSADRPSTMLDAPGDGSPAPTTETADPALADGPLACAAADGVTRASVLRVELARWQGRPAALLTTGTGPSGSEVVVYALDCVAGDGELARSPTR